MPGRRHQDPSPGSRFGVDWHCLRNWLSLASPRSAGAEVAASPGRPPEALLSCNATDTKCRFGSLQQRLGIQVPERTESARPSAAASPVRVRFDRFELDEANARLLRDGAPVSVAPTPFGVLCALARQPGALLTTNALLDQVWGHQFVTDSVLRTAISELRTALDDDARKPRFIETVSRRGYRFIATTSAIVAAAPSARNRVESNSLQPPSFIGRAHALSRLHDNWHLACAGSCRIVWVAGDPGIGKTTLVEHFIASLGDVVCARGQCVDQYGSGEPYLPVLEALSQLCRNDGTLVQLLREVAPTWLLQLPWFTTAEERDALRRDLTGVSPDRMLREMGELLARSGERRPLLLVTEDLHWSDRATIQLIDYLARRRGSTPLMWLATFRLAEVVALDHPLNRLRRELRLHALCEEIVLDPFSEREVAAYLTARAPPLARDEPFVRALHERTDGLPLFVDSVMTDVIAHGADAGDGAAAPDVLAKIAVPENLAAIIDHYIASLTDDQRLVLSAAAVCGVEFRVHTVASALERDAVWVAGTCDALAREGLWLAPPPAAQGNDGAEPPCLFRHALFRQVLYERTNPSLRAQLHRKVAASLEGERARRVPVTAAELAMHFEQGREPLAALRYYTEAAEAALAHFSPEECMSITESALSLLEQAPAGQQRNALELAIETLRGLAATRVLGAGDEAKSALRRAYSLLEQAPQHPMRGRLLHGFGFMLTLRAEYAEALEVADRAEGLGSTAEDRALSSTACTVHGQVDQLQGRPRAAVEWLERGLALSDRLDVAPGEFLIDPQVALLALLAIPLLHLGRVEHGHACLQRASARAADLQWPMARLAAIWYSALFEVRLGNAERVAALADEMHALVNQFALAHGRTAWRWFRGWADARRGSSREAYRHIREAYEDNARLGMLAGASEVLGYATEALLLAGDLDGAQKQLDEALQFAARTGERVYLPQLCLIEAAIARARGEAAAADAATRRAVTEARAQEAPWLELMALTDLGVHDGATAQDLHALAVLVDALPEARATTAVRNARALLKKATST
jgi:DNA-binding winged helix-turn-helix (wHTH) protein